MRQIGFKNFRKFKDFPTISLAPITILVGANNAGKSTVVKGILALSDFLTKNEEKLFGYSPIDYFLEDCENTREKRLKLLKEIRFYFNTSYLAHIGTFKRALYNKAENDTITFFTDLGALRITIMIEGDRHDEEAVSGRVKLVKINISKYNIDLINDIDSDKATIIFNPNPLEGTQPTSENQKRYFDEVKEEMTFQTSLSESWMPYRGRLIQSFIDMFEMLINSTIVKAPHAKDFVSVHDWDETPFIVDLDKESIEFLQRIANIIVPNSITEDMMIAEFRFMRKNNRFFRLSDIEYLYAHSVSQTVIYSSKDESDYLSKTIHEFAPHQKTKHKRDFVLKWMKEFGIGTDFLIKSVGGEAYVVSISNSDGEQVNLADKGMGSIQLMVLLFRIAISLPLDTTDDSPDNDFYEKVIIIEEPEQNLHPMLQSKLADLFFELSRLFEYKFIIETHSEYLIRKTQVIVSERYNNEEKLKNNPFKVYYFPSEDVPYEVVYRPNGRFENDFGKGFFDEAADLSFKLF